MAPARQRFGLLGRGVATGLPRGYLAAQFLEFTGEQYMRFPVAVNNDFGLSFDATKVEISEVNNFPISWQRQNPFSAFRISVNASYGTILWWNAGTLQHNAPSSSRRLWQGNFKNSRMLRVEGDGHSVEKPITVDITANYDEVCFGKLMVLGENTVHQPAAFKAFAIKMSQGADVVYDLVPCVNENGVPGLYDCVGKCCYQNQGAGQFIVGMNLEQARKLGNLPKTGGELTVSLPWEAQLVQHNGEVETALETARSKGWLLKVQYRESEPDGVIYNKYATCASVADMQAVNPDYKQDLTADGEWIYPLDKLETEEGLFYAAEGMKIFRKTLHALKKANVTFQKAGLVELEIDLPVLTSSTNLAYGCGSLKLVSVNAPNATKMTSTIHNSYLATTLKGYFPKVATAYSMCYGACSLHTVEAEFPALIDASGMFHNCILNKESALRVTNSVPEYTSGTHRITIGIHIDNQTDEEVLSAIENTEAKGWTVTVQWNGKAGTSTASTYGLRRQPIYAKVMDGVLDWGHYVTNWEENGYLEFASVEEAREYFNIEETEL